VAVHRFFNMGAEDSRSLRYEMMSACNISFVNLSFPFDGFWGDICAARILATPCAALHGALGSYLRDAFHEGTAEAVTCLHPCSSGLDLWGCSLLVSPF
jgi:hypothetical protein